ncbi:uncharacterized protein METZ01_LOCUS390972, partial [marine metagenome]
MKTMLLMFRWLFWMFFSLSFFSAAGL